MKNENGKDISALIADKPALLRAMRAGVRKALLQHKLLGQPIVVWRNGKVVEIPPEKIPVGLLRRRRNKTKGGSSRG